VNVLLADASKARNVLAWEPTVGFEELIQLMVNADIQDVENKLSGGTELLRTAMACEGRYS
jgi:GDPmannose 4,6-dehydratase